MDIGGVEFGYGRFDQRQRIGHEVGVTVEQRHQFGFEHLGDLGRAVTDGVSGHRHVVIGRVVAARPRPRRTPPPCRLE